MKKTLLVLSTILAMSMIFVGCPKDPETKGDDKSTPATSTPATSAPDAGTPDATDPEDSVVIDYTDNITIVKNNNYETGEFSNYQVNIECLKDIKLEKGQKVKVNFSADMSRSVETIQGNFVDTTQAAEWWKVINSPTDLKLVEGGEFVEEVTFEIAESATAVGAAKFVIYTNGEESDGEITLTNVNLKLTIQ